MISQANIHPDSGNHHPFHCDLVGIYGIEKVGMDNHKHTIYSIQEIEVEKCEVDHPHCECETGVMYRFKDCTLQLEIESRATLKRM